MEIILDIQSCKQCPFCKITRHYTRDSWEELSDWTCGKVDKSIEQQVNWNETPEVPIWCPSSIKNYETKKD